mgnify:CR=1 FL=1
MSQFKRKLSAFTAMLALISFSGAAMAVTSSDVIGKTGNTSVVDTSKVRTDLNITSGKAGDVGQIDFKNFNVGKGEHLNYGFSNVSQTMINRVLGGNESQILGKITNSCINGGSCSSYATTSKVILINPAGVMFGQGSTVDLNSFTVSTFDFNGAKNLKGMTNSALDSYQKGTLNKLSPTAAVNGEGRAYGNITFDSNYTQAFKDAGIDMNKFAGKTKITLDGTHFDNFTYDNNYNITGVAEINKNKSLDIVSDNVAYKDSLIRTGSNYNYGSYNQSFGNVRIVTADGVTFSYLGNGYTNGYKVAADTKNNVTRTVSIDNSGLAKDKTAIRSGDVRIENRSNAAGSDIKIKNTLIKATKLVNGENGNVLIVGSKNVELANSRIDTVNTSVTANGKTENTKGKTGGEVYISADKNLKVSDSVITTAGTTSTASASAAAVRLYSQGGDVNVKNTRVLSDGNLKAIAYNNVNVDNSLLQASNTVDSSQTKNAEISGASSVNIKNTVVHGTGDVNITSKYTNGKVAGNINISSDKANGQNQTLISAGKNLSVEGANTTLDNASLAYSNIKFYGNNTTGINNVTVKNDTTFSPKTASGSVSKNITLETNGDFTMDKATMKAAAYSMKLNRVNPNDSTSDLVDDGTANAIGYTLKITPANAGNLKVTSTQGNVNVKNSSNITTTNTTLESTTKNVNINDSTLTASKDININAAKDATINKSTLDAGNNANVTAKGGALHITNSAKIAAKNDINLTSNDSINFGKDADSNVNIGNTSNIQAGHNINVKSTAGNITAEKTTMPVLTYGNRLAFDAKKDNVFTSENSLKSVNVDYKAGGANKFYTNGDNQFVNSTLEAPENFIESGHDVIMNNLTIKQATTNAKDTVTKIYANGNVTTDDVTGTAAADVAKSVKEFPQSVSTNRTGTGKTTLDISKTKLAVTTEVVKDSANPDNGSITLDVKNADNKEAGVELTAQNVAALDKDPTGGNFRTGYYKSGTQKWDENIAAKEGPEIRLNATDNKISIKKLTSDKLTLDTNDTKIADKTNGTPVITVRDQGGFNLDPKLDYNDGTPNGFTYDKNYNTKDKTTTGGDLTFGEWSEWKPTGEAWTDPDGTTHKIYESTRDGNISDKTTTQIDQAHKITFDNNGNPGEFELIYDKKLTTVDPGKTITAEQVKNDSSVVPPGYTPDDFIKTKDDICEPEPPVNPDFGDLDSYINQTTLPREQVEISKSSTVADGTADQTSSIMSAAAKVDISEEDSNALNTTKDDEKDID